MLLAGVKAVGYDPQLFEIGADVFRCTNPGCSLLGQLTHVPRMVKMTVSSDRNSVIGSDPSGLESKGSSRSSSPAYLRRKPAAPSQVRLILSGAIFNENKLGALPRLEWWNAGIMEKWVLVYWDVGLMVRQRRNDKNKNR
jgi:hypothetical protein